MSSAQGGPQFGQPAQAYPQSGATGYAAAPSSDEYGYADNTAQSFDGQHVLTDDGHPEVEHTSVGSLIGQVTTDLSTLMRQELELAKAELKAEANKATDEAKAQAGSAGKGIGMFVGAAVAGLMVLVLLSCALWWALASAMPTGWAALIVGVLWIIIAAVLASMGRKALKQVDLSRFKKINPKPEQTVETLQQVPGALKPN